MLEKQFRLLGFSKKFMGDKSSYWWEKKIGKELILVIDVGFNIYYLDHEEWRWDNKKWKKVGYTTIKYFKNLNESLEWLQNQ